MSDRLVCRDCHRVQGAEIESQCEACGGTALTEDWAGYVIIAHPETSDIAEEMEVADSGKYALKVR